MNIENLYEFCASLKGTTEEFPFDQETLAFKVGGKIFCLTGLDSWESGNPAINLKCNPEKAIALRQEYEAVAPGYHMSKMHWNTVGINQDASDKLILKWLQDSYNLVFASLLKKIQK
ncbi:MAG: MmcQ/YjbR family DNA-binding protein [Flavobacterium sp.]